MPKTEIVIYQEKVDDVPLLGWMESLPQKLQDKWTARFELLEQQGYELRRPIIGKLRDKIYELRVEWKNVNYRVLYGFVGQNVVLLTHGCSKEGKVPEGEIDDAIERRQKYLSDPEGHTYTEE
jgi:hypothetical protein